MKSAYLMEFANHIGLNIFVNMDLNFPNQMYLTKVPNANPPIAGLTPCLTLKTAPVTPKQTITLWPLIFVT